MLDLFAVGPLETVGTVVGVAVSTLVQGLVTDTVRVTSANALTVNTGLVLLGFLIGLYSEIRQPGE